MNRPSEKSYTGDLQAAISAIFPSHRHGPIPNSRCRCFLWHHEQNAGNMLLSLRNDADDFHSEPRIAALRAVDRLA